MAKKEKVGAVESLRADVQALADAFWSFKDAMLTETAVRQAEHQAISSAAPASANAVGWSAPTATDIDSGAALLAALGHPQRMRIAMELAGAPITVNELVEKLQLKTTGAAYHHLNVLTNAGIAQQPQRGTFALANEVAVSKVLAAIFGEQPEEEPEPEEPTSSKKSKKK